MQALATLPTDAVPAHLDGDRAIRWELLTRLSQQAWTDFGDRNVTVSDGVVHLWGLIGSSAEREGLVTLAAEVPDVKRVEDEMPPAY